MTENQYAQGITAQNLRLLLNFLPMFFAEAEQTHEMLLDDKDKILGKDAELMGWCHLYELPAIQHWSLIVACLIQEDGGLLQREQVMAWLKQLKDTPGQIG